MVYIFFKSPKYHFHVLSVNIFWAGTNFHEWRFWIFREIISFGEFLWTIFRYLLLLIITQSNINLGITNIQIRSFRKYFSKTAFFGFVECVLFGQKYEKFSFIHIFNNFLRAIRTILWAGLEYGHNHLRLGTK